MKYCIFRPNYLLIIVALLGINSSFANIESKAKFVEVENSYISEDLALLNDQGQKIFFNYWDGKCVLLVFWANWCAPCLSNIIELDILQKDFRKLPFEVVAISEDPVSSRTAERFFAQEDIRNLKIYYDFNNQFFKDLNVAGLPSSFIIDVNGKILYKFTGPVDWFNLKFRQTLLSAIPGNHEMPKVSNKETSLNQIIKSKKIENINNLESKE